MSTILQLMKEVFKGFSNEELVLLRDLLMLTPEKRQMIVSILENMVDEDG